MATLVPTQVTRAGVTETLSSAAVGGDVYDNSNSPELVILNGSGAPITLYAAVYADGQTIVQGRSWTIGAGLRVRIAPMTAVYNNPSNGFVSLTYSAVTTVTIGLYY